jgi:succinyl-CoA synthetase beta subunit
MKIHEFQAKTIMSQYGIPVPQGGVASTTAEVKEIAAQLGGEVAIKAQIYAGGRGKAGGIKLASSAEEAARLAAEMMGKNLVTHQTSPQGVPIDRVLVEQAIEVKGEFYLGIVIDGSTQAPVMMASSAGGMDIEEVAQKSPEKIAKIHLDPVIGFRPFQGRKLSGAMGFNLALTRPATELMANLYCLFREKDCSLAEINPLVITKQANLVALDAKLNFDDNALFRHPDIAQLHDPRQEDAMEAQAASWGVKNYVKLNGNIGCMVNGAGLAMSILDLLTLSGGSPANFLDIGTVNTTERVVNAFRIFTADPDVKAVLVNIFGGMARVDVIAQGIKEAYRQMDIRVPLIVRLAGTNVEQGKRILAESGIKFTAAQDLAHAARLTVEAARIS